MIGGLISNALSAGAGNGLITSALCVKVPQIGGTGKLIINATDMDYSTGVRYKATWCYGYLKNANGDNINSGQNICNTTFDEIEAGAYTIDIVSAQNVKLNFQTHYEFTVKAGEIKIVNLDNERYFVQYMFGLEAGNREAGCWGALNPPAKHTTGVSTVIYQDGECVSKFSNYKLVIDNQIIAETKDYIINSLWNDGFVGNYSYEVPQQTYVGGNSNFVTVKRFSTLKNFNPYTNVFTYETVNPNSNNPDTAVNVSRDIDSFVQSAPRTFCSVIKNYIVNNLVPSFYMVFDKETINTADFYEDGKYVIYDVTYLAKDAKSVGTWLTQEEIQNIRNSVSQETGVDNIREYEAKLIKYDEQLCNAISDLNPQYKWTTSWFTPKYIEPYKWQYNVYTGFTYKA